MKPRPRHISYPSIEQFRHKVNEITHFSSITGYDDTGEPIIDLSSKPPTLRVIGSVKLHGTNMGIGYNNNIGLWYQSRTRTITPIKDNEGCVEFLRHPYRDVAVMHLINNLAKTYNINTDTNIITVFGEWLSGRSKKGVCAIHKAKVKGMFIFDVKVTPINENKEPYWIVNSYDAISKNITYYNDHNIYHIDQYRRYAFDVDFNNPNTEDLQKAVTEVENECPVGLSFGISGGIGEGIVFRTWFNKELHFFKMKGTKHTKKIVKRHKPVSDEYYNFIMSIANKVTPEWRLEQMYNEMFNGKLEDVKRTGEFIKKVFVDIKKEDQDILDNSEVDGKILKKHITTICREYIMGRLNS